MSRKYTSHCTLWTQLMPVKSIGFVRMPRVIEKKIFSFQTLIATGPLCVYISGFLTSFPMRTVNRSLGRKPTMIVGLTAVLLSSGLFWSIFTLKETLGVPIQWTILLGVILLGIGITTAQITSSAFTSDLIGPNTVENSFGDQS